MRYILYIIYIYIHIHIYTSTRIHIYMYEHGRKISILFDISRADNNDD